MDQHGVDSAKEFAEREIGFDAVCLWRTQGSSACRRKALYLLSLWMNPEVIAQLADSLRGDESAVVRHEAAFFLGASKDELALDPLLKALAEDTEALVRHEAAEALGDLGSSRALEGLMAASRDTSPIVRETAVMAIAQLTTH
jgi:deoxyhypusine monooxygenase